MEVNSGQKAEFKATIEAIKGSISSTRNALKILRESKADCAEMKEGISLLSLKHNALLSYLQSLLLLSARRTLGHAFIERTRPIKPFGSVERETRGSDAGDLVDAMVEERIVLEKIKLLESRMKYQIDKLVRIAQEPEKQSNIVDDPLAFRPNPQNLLNGDDDDTDNDGSDSVDDSKTETKDGIYRPPRVAPMPYTEAPRKGSRKDRDRLPAPTALTSLLDADPTRPHIETTSGLGNTPSLASGRAKYLKRLEDYEEDNFTRVVMKKRDAKRRLRDEEDLALGGSLGGEIGVGKNRRRGGLEDEFGDVLKSAARSQRASFGTSDGYDELRHWGKKRSVLERSRGRPDDDLNGVGENGGSEDGKRKKQRTRFELEAKRASAAKRKQSRKNR